MDMLKRGFALLAKARDFRYLMGAQFLAQAGDGLVQAALAKFIVFGEQKGFDVENARSPDEVLRIVLYIFVPYTIVSPFLGVVIDRWDRRRLLFVANGLRALVVAIIGLVGTGAVPDVALFLAFLLTLAATRIVLATKSAALPATVDNQGLVEANAVSQLGGAMFQLGGAGVALIAINAKISTELIVLVGAAAYALGAVSALLIKRAGEARASSSLGEEIARVIRRIVEGLREVARVPQAGASITTYFWLRFLWSFSLVGMGFIARELVADDLQVVLLTGGAGAIGAVLGFVLARVLHRRVRTTARLVAGASLLGGLAVTGFGALLLVLPDRQVKLALASVALLLGFGFFLGKISLDTLVQEALGDDFRGRAFSLYDIAYNFAWVLAAAILKVAWDDDSAGEIFAAVGIAFLIGMAALMAWFRRAGLMEERSAEAVSAVP